MTAQRFAGQVVIIFITGGGSGIGAATARRFADDVTAEHGKLNVLVNNAGTGSPGDVTHTSDDDWSRVVQTNLDAVFYGCRAAMPHLVASGGCIVNVTSVSGLGGDWANVAYNAAKAGW